MYFKSKAPVTETSNPKAPHQDSVLPNSQDDTAPPTYAAVSREHASARRADLIQPGERKGNYTDRCRAKDDQRARLFPCVHRVHSAVLTRRRHYLKHYAKDAAGTYIGTEKAAVDAGLVFVPSQSSSQDLLEQVRKVAFGKEHGQGAFQVGYAMEYRGTESKERGV
ncbi:hypothetical protein OPT61_g8182 [Boeremia exigua]|uniref:Uncharacterized protein n=1 Tax=Boeremia exigua TaxID=749465 RepID=A0ACC2HZC1_9PLEO|nr:hypothetical protein OPT61_g8182 [Boeremia exigua]